MMNRITTVKRSVATIAAIVVVAGFTQPKTLKVELTKEQWEGVLQIIDESRSSHLDVKTVQGWIVPQLQEQLKDTTK